MWNRKELKKKGKAAFLGNYWRCVLIAFLLTLFVAGTSASAGGTATNGVKQTNNGPVTVTVETDDGNQIELSQQEIDAALQDPDVVATLQKVFAVIGSVLLIGSVISLCLRLLIFNPLEVGCRGFFGKNAESPAVIDDLKTGFRSYGRTVGAMFLRDLFLFLWSLLFIIPGIIKSYSYRMVPYILADDPTITAREAITLSRKIMNGNKWKTFVLDLSFIGWGILSALTLGLLGIFYVNPYIFCTDAQLYHEIKDR